MLEANQIPNMKSPRSSDDGPSLFDRAIAAERLWMRYCEDVWSQKPAGTPEFEHATLECSVLSECYHALFREFCNFALANPSLDALGKVIVLWRLRCWDSEGPIGTMEDEFEARAIIRLSEILTGISQNGGDHV